LRFKNFASLVMLVTAGLAVGAPVAHAQENLLVLPASVTNNGSDSVRVEYSGNALKVTDNHADGHSAVAVYWPSGTSQPSYIWNTQGAGTSELLNVGLVTMYWACLGEGGPEQVMWDTCGKSDASAGAVNTGGSGAVAAAQTPSASPLAAEEISVMTWNIGNGATTPDGGFNDPRGWAQTIADAGAPLVVALQEACRTRVEALLAELRTHNLVYDAEYGPTESRDNCKTDDNPDGSYGEAILAWPRMDMRDLTMKKYDTQLNENEDFKGYMAVTITVDGAPVRVFATHLAQGNNPAIRTAQAKELAQATMGTPAAFVMGDFNTDPEEGDDTKYGDPKDIAGMAPLWNAGFRDVDRDCNRNTNPVNAPSVVPQCGTTLHRTNGLKDAKFDYILTRLFTEQTNSARTLITSFSDHQPLIGAVHRSPGWSGSTSAASPLTNYGSNVAQVWFDPTGDSFFVKDGNANGLSAVGVYWQQELNRWNMTVIWNHNTSDGPDNPVERELGLPEGSWFMYMSCSGYFTDRTVFWDTCGDQRLNTA
jgi:endonuclease/exonuclease/phosphatase family metal-dependent hydrolase